MTGESSERRRARAPLVHRLCGDRQALGDDLARQLFDPPQEHDLAVDVGEDDPGWDGQAQFLGAAATAMRHIIVDGIRRKSRLKRGGNVRRVDEDVDRIEVEAAPSADVLAMSEALEALEELDPRKARVVTLRSFGGLTMTEAAKVMGLSLATVEREWRFARNWIQQRVEAGRDG